MVCYQVYLCHICSNGLFNILTRPKAMRDASTRFNKSVLFFSSDFPSGKILDLLPWIEWGPTQMMHSASELLWTLHFRVTAMQAMPADERFASCAHCNMNLLLLTGRNANFERYKMTFSSKEVTGSSIVEGQLLVECKFEYQLFSLTHLEKW